jgi:hypothetical protein
MYSRWLLLSTVLMAVACGGKSPTEPTVPACERNNSAILVFGNRSPTNTTYDVSLDGVRVATIAPGTNSAEFTVAAGATHSVQFRVTNTTLPACNTGFPVPLRCSNEVLTCSGV